MRKKMISTTMLFAAALGLIAYGCSPSAVWGVPATGAPVAGTVTLKDSSTPPQVRTVASDSGGNYTVNTSILKPPFLLKVEWTDNGAANRMYSAAEKSGRANINPLTHTALAGASRSGDPDELYDNDDHDEVEHGPRT